MSSNRVLLRILIADDNGFVRQGLRDLIGTQQDMEVVAEAGDGQEAVALFRAHEPDVTLMDFRMPGLNGIGAIEAITAEFPEAYIVLLTTFEDEIVNTDRALAAGASKFLLKDVDGSELFQAIRAVGDAADDSDSDDSILPHRQEDIPATSEKCRREPFQCENHCAYFSLSIDTIYLSGLQQPMRVPLYRCALTEALIERLEEGEGNEYLLSHLRGPVVDGKSRPVIGCDYAVMSPTACTRQRESAHCVPSFVTMLTEVGLDPGIPADC